MISKAMLLSSQMVHMAGLYLNGFNNEISTAKKKARTSGASSFISTTYVGFRFRPREKQHTSLPIGQLEAW